MVFQSNHKNSQGLDTSQLRLISRILVLYYFEEYSQADIAKLLNTSPATVSRLLKFAKKNNLVEFKINTPFLEVFELENKLMRNSNLTKAIVVPDLAESDEVLYKSVGKAAADYFISEVKRGDIVGIGGGHTINIMFKEITEGSNFEIIAVPCIGGYTGLMENSTNYLSDELAKKLGGESKQLHAPAFVENSDIRNSLMSMDHVKDVLDYARQASIILVSVGAIDPETSSFYKFTNLPSNELENLIESRNASGEITSHLFDTNGKLCAPEYSNRVVGLTLEEVKSSPLTIGIAFSKSKVTATVAALKGNLINALIIDEPTARDVISILKADD